MFLVFTVAPPPPPRPLALTMSIETDARTLAENVGVEESNEQVQMSPHAANILRFGPTA